MRALSVQYVSLDRLTPSPENPRTHSLAQIRQIAASVRAFGFTNPVLVDEAGRILAGHGRVAAARELGLAEVPTIRLDAMTEAQKRAYVIADNKLAENAGWDRDLLRLELGALAELSFELPVLGFADAELDLLLLDDPADAEETVEVPDRDRPSISRLGDVWTLGEHRLVVGDALDGSSYPALMGEERADLVVTDPPYNVPIDGFVSSGGKHGAFAMASGEMSEAEFIAFLKGALGLAVQHSREGALHFVCMDWRHLFELLSAGRELYGGLINLCVWRKSNGGMGSLYRSQHELVLVWRHGTGPHINNVALGRFGRNRTNVWDYPGVNVFGPGRDALLAQHPTVKPVQLIADAILDASPRGGIVLDPFCGSGTILLACERTGRCARAIEIDPAYADGAIRRWQAETGGVALREVDGACFADLTHHALTHHSMPEQEDRIDAQA